jgi:hypothetical protein
MCLLNLLARFELFFPLCSLFFFLMFLLSSYPVPSVAESMSAAAAKKQRVAPATPQGTKRLPQRKSQGMI